MTVDSNRWDAPVATVAYSYTVTGSATLNARSGPGPSYPVVAPYPAGTTIKIVCQTPGSTVGSTKVWDKLTSGAYVTDHYLSTPSSTTYSAPVPRCKYPYQVTRSTPERAARPVGQLRGEGDADQPARWPGCSARRPARRSTPSSVWDQLDDGYYVTDYYLATPSTTTYSRPIPRC